MRPDREPAVLLATVATEFEAALMVNALEARGIAARSAGALTAGFRAEAPGRVQVLVRERDLAEARDILKELKEARGRDK